MKDHKIRFGLRAKFTVIILCLGILLTAAVVVTGVMTFRTSITNNYNAKAYEIAKAAEKLYTTEQLRSYADLAMRYNHGEASDEEVEAVMSSGDYQTSKVLLDGLRSGMGANDIYIYVFDLEVMDAYTEEGYANKTWRPLYYLVDSYYIQEEQYPLGATSRVKPAYREEFHSLMLEGKVPASLMTTNGDFGATITSAWPVADDLGTAAIISVEIPMTTLSSDIATYIRNVLINALLVMLLLLTIVISFIMVRMIRPIVTVTREAKAFVGNNAVISEVLPKIHTGDEIEVLSGSILSLERDINTYIDNLTRVTAEKERIGAELNVATQIQADMLPRIFPPFPERHEFDIFATMDPAKEVGGDFYDFFLIDDDHIGLVMADVSGKGVPAALFMVIAKTLIKNRALMGGSPGECLAYANEQLCEGNEAELFVTVWMAIVEISTGKGIAANAGHEHPTIRRSGGDYELVIYRHSPAVATMEGMKFKEHEFVLHPGDSLYVYTDGVAEATNAQDELYGTERMLQTLNEKPDAAPRELLERVKASIDTFVGEAPQFDDITMLGFTYFGGERDG